MKTITGGLPAKIIFLDIDGVVNIPPYNMFDVLCMERLKYIIQQTGAKIVVSSSWRCSDSTLMKEQFDKHGFPQDLWDEIIGITVHGYTETKKGSSLPIPRGVEIKHWIDRHLVYPWHANPELDHLYKEFKEDQSFKKMFSNKLGKDFVYIILDDDADMLLEQAPWFIKTSSETGLTDNDMKSAIDKLNLI